MILQDLESFLHTEMDIDMSTNPWESDPAFINVGGLSKILDMHKRLSHSCSRGYMKQCSSSIEFIDTLKNLSHLHAKQNQLNVEYQTKKLYQDFYNILHTDVLDGLISMIDFLVQHLQHVLDTKEKIINHLQTPFVGEYIITNAQYQRDVSDFFPLVAKHLADLSTILYNFEWMNKYSAKNADLINILESVMSSLTSLQRRYHAMDENRDLMNSMMKKKLSNTPSEQ